MMSVNKKKELIEWANSVESYMSVKIFTVGRDSHLSPGEVEEVHIEIEADDEKETFVVGLDVMGYDWEGGLFVEKLRE